MSASTERIGAAGRCGTVPPGRVIVLADDLIWGGRLADVLASAGATPVRVRSGPAALAEVVAAGPAPRAIVDLTARAYDGVEAVRALAAAGVRVVAVGQHDDPTLRKSAVAAGAARVFTYRRLFEDGPSALARWLAEP